MVDMDRALFDPAATFGHPRDVLQADDIDILDKVKILRNWEYDARELEVATEENMATTNNHRSMLAAIHLALAELNEKLADQYAAEGKK